MILLNITVIAIAFYGYEYVLNTFESIVLGTTTYLIARLIIKD